MLIIIECIHEFEIKFFSDKSNKFDFFHFLLINASITNHSSGLLDISNHYLSMSLTPITIWDDLTWRDTHHFLLLSYLNFLHLLFNMIILLSLSMLLSNKLWLLQKLLILQKLLTLLRKLSLLLLSLNKLTNLCLVELLIADSVEILCHVLILLTIGWYLWVVAR